MFLLIILAAIFGIFTFNVKVNDRVYDNYDWNMSYVEKASDSVRVEELVSSEEINPTKLLMDFINSKH